MSNRVNIELSTDQLAEELSRWSYEDLMELLKTVDEKKSEWDFVVKIKAWADGEHKKMAAEELEDKALREEKCQRSAEYPDLHFHVDPHRGCVLR
jgi:hypothetical protein